MILLNILKLNLLVTNIFFTIAKISASPAVVKFAVSCSVIGQRQHQMINVVVQSMSSLITSDKHCCHMLLFVCSFPPPLFLAMSAFLFSLSVILRLSLSFICLFVSVGWFWSGSVCRLWGRLSGVMGCFPSPSVQLSEGTSWASHVSRHWCMQAERHLRVFREDPPILDPWQPAKPSGEIPCESDNQI